MTIKTILFFIFIIGVTQLYGQDFTSSSRKAVQYYKDAGAAFEYLQVDKALELTDLAIEKDSLFVEAWLLKAQILNLKELYCNEVEAYNHAIRINEDFFKYTLLLSAKANIRCGDYQKALIQVNRLLGKRGTNEKVRKKGAYLKEKILYSIYLQENPVDIDPEILDGAINNVGDVYWPSMTVDNTMFFFTARLPFLNTYQEDICSSVYSNGEFTDVQFIDKTVLSSQNEGASFVSPDGRYLLFTGCNRNDGFGSCDLYLSKQVDGMWHRSVNLGRNVNTRHWESRPVITSDGKELYFTSNRPGGKGGADIWFCKRVKETSDGYPIWSKPKNIGDSINTPGDEIAPFIHADNQTLYFSSDFHNGLGGQDLFISRRLNDSTWSAPVNLGFPINNHTNEIGLFIDAAGYYAYYASSDSVNKRSIYRFVLPQKIRPRYVTYVRVFVKDKVSFRPLNADVELFDILTGNNITTMKSEGGKGSALICLPTNQRYGLNIEKNGYLFYSDHFDLVADSTTNVKELEVLLQPIEKGKSIVLNNIFFQTDSYNLSHDSEAELLRVKRFLTQNPGIKVEIGGHTDNQGAESYNQKLSENRAKAVYQYLINNGIDNVFLTYKGYGMKDPISDNSNEMGRAKNRRTELRIIDI